MYFLRPNEKMSAILWYSLNFISNLDIILSIDVFFIDLSMKIDIFCMIYSKKYPKWLIFFHKLAKGGHLNHKKEVKVSKQVNLANW